jgi:hypothetical protein
MLKKVNARREKVNPDYYLEFERLREKAYWAEVSALNNAKKKASIKIAAKLLEDGTLSHQEILELTELTEEDLQDILKKIGKTE